MMDSLKHPAAHHFVVPIGMKVPKNSARHENTGVTSSNCRVAIKYSWLATYMHLKIICCVAGRGTQLINELIFTAESQNVHLRNK